MITIFTSSAKCTAAMFPGVIWLCTQKRTFMFNEYSEIWEGEEGKKGRTVTKTKGVNFDALLPEFGSLRQGKT